jgi:hypothetical protein
VKIIGKTRRTIEGRSVTNVHPEIDTGMQPDQALDSSRSRG